MLVLRRKVGQHIVIAGEVRFSILEIHGNQVKLGIEAPVHTPVLRGELMPLAELPSLTLKPMEPTPPCHEP